LVVFDLSPERKRAFEGQEVLIHLTFSPSVINDVPEGG